MMETANSWTAILGNKIGESSDHLFNYLVNTGEPWEGKPAFCTENEGLPYEVIVTADSLLCVSGLMKFNADTAEWECLKVEPMGLDAPLSAWEVTSIDNWEGEKNLAGNPPSHISLINEMGKEISVDCPVYAVMRESLAEGKRFRLSLYMVTLFLQKEEKVLEVTSGKVLEMERERRAQSDSSFKPEDLKSVTVDLTGKRAVLQGREGKVTDFLTMIEEVQPVEMQGHYGYKMKCDLAPQKDIPLLVDMYAFESSLKGYIPQKGDYVSGGGFLYGVPVEEINAKEAGMSFPSDAPEPELSSKDKEWMEFLSTRPELPLATKVLIGSFIRTGWQVVQASTKYFSKMVPAFIARKPKGSTYAVFVDCRQEGKYEYPDLNAAELRDIESRCREYGYKTIRFRVDVMEEGKNYRYAITPIGRFPQKMAFETTVKKPSRKMVAEEVVKSAVAAFAQTVNSADMTYLSAWLDEDLHYTSQTVDTDIHGKITFLRYFTVALAQWEKSKMLPKAVTGTVSWKNRRHPCMALIHDGKVTACTVMRARGGYVTEMATLPENSYEKFKEDK